MTDYFFTNLVDHPSTMTISGRLSTHDHRIKLSSSCADRCPSAQTWAKNTRSPARL